MKIFAYLYLNLQVVDQFSGKYHQLEIWLPLRQQVLPENTNGTVKYKKYVRERKKNFDFFSKEKLIFFLSENLTKNKKIDCLKHC